MAQDADHPLIHRIEGAIARIEAAARAHAFATERLTRRHEALRERMAEAVDAMDELIAREGGKGEDA